MRIKSQRDFLSGLLFIAVGLSFAVGASAQDLGSLTRPGAGFFALGLGLVLALLGLAVWFKSMTIETERGDPLEPLAWRALLGVLAAVAVFGWTLPHWGLSAAVPLATGLVALAHPGARWRDVLALALAATLASALILAVVQPVALPGWPMPRAG